MLPNGCSVRNGLRGRSALGRSFLERAFPNGANRFHCHRLENYLSPVVRMPRRFIFPDCINRIMGSSLIAGKASIVETFLTVSQRAGISVWLPDDVFGYCCGTPFSSKGYETHLSTCFPVTVDKLWEWSRGGTCRYLWMPVRVYILCGAASLQWHRRCMKNGCG